MTFRLIILFVSFQVVNTLLSDSQVGENEEFMDAILVPAETSTQSSHVTMVDKEIDAVKKVKSCRTQYSLLDIGINEDKERTKACR